MESVTSLVTTNFTQKHSDISSSFIRRIIGMLEAENSEVETYAIDTKAYPGETEAIKINLGEKMYLEIKVVTRKS